MQSKPAQATPLNLSLRFASTFDVDKAQRVNIPDITGQAAFERSEEARLNLFCSGLTRSSAYFFIHAGFTEGNVWRRSSIKSERANIRRLIKLFPLQMLKTLASFYSPDFLLDFTAERKTHGVWEIDKIMNYLPITRFPDDVQQFTMMLQLSNACFSLSLMHSLSLLSKAC